MTLITFQNGTVVMRGNQVGTEQACCCDSQLFCCECKTGRNTGEITEDYFVEQDAIDALNQGDADAAALVAFLDANGWCNAAIVQAGFIEFIDDGVFQFWRVHYAVITAGCCGGLGDEDPPFSTVTYGGEDTCLNDGTNLECYPCTQQDCTDNPCCVEVGPEPCTGPSISIDSEYPKDGCKNPLP